jgi:RNA polymerase sigma factor for flagellar operon FliA
MTESAEQIWQRYKTEPHDELKKQLMTRYLGLVKYVVHGLNLAQSHLLSEDDLVNIGILGLHEAIDRFDPERGIKFETYAIPRIKGMIIDEMRKIDWVPRSVREKSRQIHETVHRLEGKQQREVSPWEVAEELSISVEEYRQLETGVVPVVSLDKPLHNNEPLSLHDIIASSDSSDPGEAMDTQQLREALIESIQQLPDKQRSVIALYYYEELTLKEIGAVLGISESRVSQIHTEVLSNLRQTLRHLH